MRKLIAELSKLPTIGEKSATRLAYHLIKSENGQANTLANAILAASASVKLCERCFFLSESSLCSICSNTNRDSSLLCVVEKPMDLVAIERVGEYRGYYHVLHGLWAPLRGMGPEDMKLAELMDRIVSASFKEIILATGSTVEGDATALYIANLLHEQGVATSRLAQGMPKGGELEYADELTLARAFAGRNSL